MSVFLLGSAQAAAANTCAVPGVAPPDTLDIPGNDGKPLVLNGLGARTKFFWNVYVGALYLPRRSTDVGEILAMSGPKRIWLHFLRGVSEEKLLEGWRDGFQHNNTPEQRAALEERLTATYPLFRDMEKGESIAMDYLPGVGTRLWMNGRAGAVIAGEDFYRAVLKVWLGNRPAQTRLRQCMLGEPG